MVSSLLSNMVFYSDSLSVVMSSLVLFVSTIVSIFSLTYLEGTASRFYFFPLFFTTAVSVLLMVHANHFVLLWLSWTLANYCLTALIGYKQGWKIAQASSRLVWQFLLSGSISLGAGFLLLYFATGHATVTGVMTTSQAPIVGLLCLVIAAIIQSALIPFHKWIVSSLNAPTPVSAFMHAGLVNGGGFLLARFAPLFLQNRLLLQMLFIVGIVTAIIGTTFKLLQTSIKNMLACSTVGQMGFMIAQCGMGLFPAAIAHACWHGLFKAYLFLDSGKAAQENKVIRQTTPTLVHFILALLCGLIASFCFAQGNHVVWLSNNTDLLLDGVALIAGTQLALPFVRFNVLRLSFLGICCAAIGWLYGFSVYLIEQFLVPLGMNQPQPLYPVYLVGFLLLVISWLCMIFQVHNYHHPIIHKLYVACLNASQPAQSTITSHPSEYYHEGAGNDQ